MKKSKIPALTEQERKERSWLLWHGFWYFYRPKAVDLKKKLLFNGTSWMTVSEYREWADTEDDIKLAMGTYPERWSCPW